MPDALLRLYLALHGALLRLRDTLADERGDVPGWVLITGMTVALVMVIWGSPRSAAETHHRFPQRDQLRLVDADLDDAAACSTTSEVPRWSSSRLSR